jgi:hypothetical protein
VETGLDLFDKQGSFNFPSLVFYETGYNLFTLRQASRRAWRIAQKHACRVYFMYYESTMQSKAMTLMGDKIKASLNLEGEFSAEGLAAMASEASSAEMELARSLADNISDTMDSPWELVNAEQPEPVAVDEEQTYYSWKDEDEWDKRWDVSEPEVEVVAVGVDDGDYYSWKDEDEWDRRWG